MGRTQRTMNYKLIFQNAVKLLRGEISTTLTPGYLREQGGLTAPQIREAMIDQGKRYAPPQASHLAQAMKASPLFRKVRDSSPIVWGAVPDDEVVARLRQHNGAIIGRRSIPHHLKRQAGLL